MKRTSLTRVLLAAFILGLTSMAFASVFPPESTPRIGGFCEWANGRVYWYGGRCHDNITDGTGKEYGTFYGTANVSVYNPTTNTWDCTKADTTSAIGSKAPATGPMGYDPDGNGKCEWNSLWATDGIWSVAGLWAQGDKGFSYDDDSDGVAELFTVGGYQQDSGSIWRFDPNNGPRGSWSKKADVTGWGGFRRGAVGFVGTKIYIASGPSIDFPVATFRWYDIVSGTQGTGPNGPESQRCSAAIVNNKFYVIGGTVNGGQDIYEIDLAHTPLAWSNSGSPIATLPVGVSFAASVVYNGKVYIIGGGKEDGTASTAIQEFNPVTKSTAIVGNIPAGRWQLGAAVDPATGTLYFGGGGDGGNIYYPDNLYTTWWKTNLPNPTTFTPISNDPASFPYDDWDPGRAISGVVTDLAGHPVPGAIIGIKASPYATADATKYLTTDINGKYGPEIITSANVYVSAWRPEFAPTADTLLSSSTADATVNLQFSAVSKKNVAINAPVTVTSGSETAAKAVDGNSWSRWESGEVATATYTVNLGSTKTVTGTVIFWGSDPDDDYQSASAANYKVEITTGDPAGAATWTPVYTATNATGGWNANARLFVDPIRFDAPVQARAIRINATKGRRASFSINEFQVMGDQDSSYAARINNVKTLPVGTEVKLNRPVTVSGVNGSSFGPAGMTFWVEESDRSSGIKVSVPANENQEPATGIGSTGDIVDLTGKVAQDATTGEIYIAATDVQPWQWAGKEFQPVGMNARALTSGMPTGLYVKTWGTVKSINTTNYSFTIADGSTKDGAPVEITVVRGANMTAALPELGQWVSIKGVLTGGNSSYKIYEWPVDGFIRGWLMNGAYSVANPGGDDIAWQSANLTNDFFASAGTELAIEPKLGDTAPNGGKWFAASIDAFSSAFDFSQLAFEPVDGQTCVYASVWVKPATDLGEDEGLQAWVGSADGYALIITNSIYASSEFGPFVYIKDDVMTDTVTPDANTISYDSSLQAIALKGGEWNHVMIKVNQIDAGFGVAARFMITDPNDSSKMIPAPLEVSLQKP